ncbi:transcription factor Opi1-domain-containing protein [Cercophora newfieldiana]|uniref:Transcription factor Opi1-domain-containing protein n=1 Tax=Cercophora newfieldiana TaxID=92897 RepID=A0AA39XT25_9PEZI|nr:transcription factor Opi1-domain-containing protein [Cercophora newfieldiana]
MQPNILADPLPLRPSHERTASRSFADTPTTELPPIQPQRDSCSSASSHTLPSLSSVTSGLQSASTEPGPPTHWPSLNPYTTFYTPSYAQPASTPPPRHPGAEMNAASPDRFSGRRSASVSLDDPDVRMAAEALGDLRADFVSSPPNRNTPLPTTPRDQRMAAPSPRDSSEQQPEPLLSLITASHPLVATTIEGATSAYNSGKDLSPHLKSSAEYIEGYLTPVAKVVGNVSRKTGVEGGVRWFLSRKYSRKHQSSSDLEGSGNHKRRKAKLSAKEMEVLDRSFPKLDDERRASISTIDTLPAYDDHRSPAYSEEVDAKGQVTSRPSSGEIPPWKTRIVVSTSSLGIAMRADSLGKLKFCLQQLRHANACVTNMMTNLQSLVEQYDAAKSKNEGNDAGESSRPSEDQTNLIAQMNTLKEGIALSVKSAIRLVSSYAGSTLPENVQNLIREQINGLPQRWRAHALREAPADEAASGSADQDKMREGARRVLLLAKEGLHLITQVSDVIDRTIKTAEDWCSTLGMRNQDGTDANASSDRVPSPAMWATPQPQPTPIGADQDTHMTG